MVICILDKGGSGTRLCVFKHGHLDCHTVITELEIEKLHHHDEKGESDALLWKSQDNFGDRIITAFQRMFPSSFPAESGKVERIVMSLTGIVDHSQPAVLIRSDRIKECMQGTGIFPWNVQACFPADTHVVAVNDGVASAVGVAAAISSSCMPALVFTLGTYPAITVADGSLNNLQVYETDFSKAVIGTSGGELPLYRCLNCKALGQLSLSRKVQRLGRAVAAVLSLYFARFHWLPKSIVFMGGHAANLVKPEECNPCSIIQKIASEFMRPEVSAFIQQHSAEGFSQVLLVKTLLCTCEGTGVCGACTQDQYVLQSRVHLNGARVYSELRMQGKISVHPVAK
jgi:hypothetical protein